MTKLGQQHGLGLHRASRMYGHSERKVPSRQEVKHGHSPLLRSRQVNRSFIKRVMFHESIQELTERMVKAKADIEHPTLVKIV